MEHTTPITFPEDETFDVGADTRTGVALVEYRYDSPFKFTGKIDKLTFKLEPEATASGRKSDRAVAMARAQAHEEGAAARRHRRSRDGLGVADRSCRWSGGCCSVRNLTGIAIPVARVAGIALIALGSPAGQVRRGSAC